MAKDFQIYDAALRCRTSLEKSLSSLLLMREGWAENRLADFNLWSAGSGVFAPGNASFDSRLASENDLKMVFVNLLETLKRLVDECQTKAREIMPGSLNDLAKKDTASLSMPKNAHLVEESQGSRKSERSRMGIQGDADQSALQKSKTDVEMAMKQIVRLTVSVRKSGSRHRLQKADGHFDPTNHQELEGHLQFLISPRPPQEFHDSNLSGLTSIQCRLVEANLRRRNRFLYAQKHSEKLAGEKIPMPKHEPQRRPTLRIPRKWNFMWLKTFASRAQRSTSLPRVARTNNHGIVAPSISEGLSATSASAVEAPIKPPAPSAPATSAVSSTNARVEYPSPPRLEDGKNHFKCPYCCQIFSKEYANKNKWRKHLAEDILPYTCILEGCPEPWELYPSRAAWLNHMKSNHKRPDSWICPMCPEPIYFNIEAEFASHLQTVHDSSIPEDALPALKQAGSRSIPFRVQQCPLCRSDAGETTLDHIAEHIHSFSLESLPPLVSDEPDSESRNEPGYIARIEALTHSEQFFAPDNTEDNNASKEAIAERLQHLAERVVGPEVSDDDQISEEEKQLREIGEECLQIAKDLSSAAGGITESFRDNWLRSTKQTAKGPLGQSQLDHLQARLERISQQLTARASSVQEGLSGEVEGEAVMLSFDRSENVRQLQEQLQRVVALQQKEDNERDLSRSSIAKKIFRKGSLKRTLEPTTMEPLTAPGIASNIIQFVDFAKSIISDTRKFYDATSGAKDEYQEAENYAQRLQHLAAQIARPQAPHSGDILMEEKELKELGERCSRIANELLEATRDVTATSHNDWVQSAQNALSSSQIKSFQTRLDRISQRTGSLLHKQLKTTEKMLNGIAAENRRLSSRRDEDIHHLQEQLQIAMKLLEKEEGQKDAAISLAGIAETGAQFSAEQFILGSLFFHGMNERYARIHVEHKETLSWIFDEDSPVRFAEFLETQSSLYWVSGKPGSGKSTAMKYICQHSETKRRLEQWANGNRLIIAKYFFWNAGRSLLKSQEGLLQSILYQIFRVAPVLIPYVFPEQWAANLSGYAIPSLYNADQFSLAKLLAAIQLLCKHLSEFDINVCIFVDGLDECDGPRSNLIELIEIFKISTNIKVCISSRPRNEFERAFGQDQTNKLYMQDLTRSDIRKYVRDTLENNANFRQLVESEGEDRTMALVHEIVDAAQGVFLWVTLVMRSLLEGLTYADRLIDLQRRVKTLPPDLEEYFGRVFLSVDDFYASQAAVMYLVTLTAAKPLPLMSYSFIDEESSRYALDLEVRPMHLQLINSRLESTRRRLNAYSHGLLEITDKSPKGDDDADLRRTFFDRKVDFMHRAVRDFVRIQLTERRLLDRLPQGFNPEIAICQALLAQVKSSPLEEELCVRNGPFENLLDTLFLHAGALEHNKIPVQTEVELLDELGGTLLIRTRLVGERHLHVYSSSSDAKFLSKCVSFGLVRYVCYVLGREPKPPPDELSSLLDDANSAAGSHLGRASQQEIIRCLLRCGADPNYRVKGTERTPWSAFIDSILDEHQRLDSERQDIVYNILQDYIKHGAALRRIPSKNTGTEADLETLMQKIFTQEKIDTLVRTKKERVSGIGRFSGFLESLKRS